MKGLAALAAATMLLASCKEDNPGKDAPEVRLAYVSSEPQSITLTLSSTGADEMAYYYTSDAEEGKKLLSGELVFSLGTSMAASVEPVEVNITELEPETAYWVYASARQDGEYSVTDSVKVVTPAVAKYLSAGEVTSTSLSYSVNAPEGATYRHMYLEGWDFNDQLASAMATEGEEFDMNVFLWNLLADYGHDAQGPSEFTWKNGDEDALKGKNVSLYGGHRYVAIFSFIEGETSWSGTAEFVEMELPAAGKSSETVEFSDETVASDRIRVRMDFDDSKVSFISYGLYKKASYDEKLEKDGEEGMKNFLYEYGYKAWNTYTDAWSAASGTEYVLAVMGVDKNGDSFLASKEYTTPLPEPVLDVKMTTYDRELEGYHDYCTVKIDVTMKNFVELDYENMVHATLMPKYQWDATFAEFGMTPEDCIATMPETVWYVIPTPFQESEMTSLKEKGTCTRIESDLESDTEYIFVVMFQYNEQWYFKSATVTLPEEPEEGEATDGYKAFLGSWTVSGKASPGYKDMTYSLRFEQLTVNRSYKVYGWSKSSAGEDFPFVARYDSASGKIVIDGYQKLGTTAIDGKNYEIRLAALIPFSGVNAMCNYDGAIYKGTVRDAGTQQILALAPEFFMRDGKAYEVQSMGYAAVNAETGNLEGGLDEFDMMEFKITRNK